MNMTINHVILWELMMKAIPICNITVILINIVNKLWAILKDIGILYKYTCNLMFMNLLIPTVFKEFNT